ncbi:two-component system, chemotaxis family, sensor kinase CheA [Allochromatium warmingii]|uniref:Chemotaxis protein CheA n=1 Tax=Allochromatium warmingii TaxID=61595 RepID=A0A1H3BAA1_ALLWA|nr:chemotaxis protein CheA [Allochromatium warmingii]SDX38867.1 two-component system, chemotaxis family, sensor kinase CheA [Allochromatium warmingii]
MNALLNQFLTEGRDFLEAIGAKLLELERTTDPGPLIDELFRLVHTLKGNSGLFDLPEMTRVLHAAEDLMDAVRDGRLEFSRELADQLLEAMDFVSLLIDEIAEGSDDGQPPRTSHHATDAARLGAALRGFLGGELTATSGQLPASSEPSAAGGGWSLAADGQHLPEAVRMAVQARLTAGEALCWVRYRPEAECFFKGEDPFFQIMQLPEVLWRQVGAVASWPPLAELDAYRCVLEFEVIVCAALEALVEHFRYVPDQVEICSLASASAATTHGNTTATTTADSTRLSAEALESIRVVLEAQREILALTDTPAWFSGRLRAVGATLLGILATLERDPVASGLETALEAALATDSGTYLLRWLDHQTWPTAHAAPAVRAAIVTPAPLGQGAGAPRASDESVKFGRRADDQLATNRTLKVDQSKIDRLMNLIGEMVVAKNALPYLAARAEERYGVRELSREIKAQYGVINRIAEEMQDAIMQIRMLPVSFVFQRFPRLVRDIAHKLGKEVRLIMDGESTEADKNIIEALADPLIHIVRNSLDHGLETPEQRRAAGKSPEGRLTISSRQESDRVLIEISDDGRGIDPTVIRHKAYEKGIIDETALERLSDQEAINLIFAAGFSTAEQITDLSGRGVGMDVVRNAIARVNGTIDLRSRVGAGTQLRLSLPLSMAVTNVMIVESAGQRFGVPMDAVAETVRVAQRDIRLIKKRLTTVLRGRLVPLVALNDLLALDAAQLANDDDELAVLVVRIEKEYLGIIVDDCRETIDIILKPLAGFLGNLAGYAGSALLGDGSVLLILNPRELL